VSDAFPRVGGRLHCEGVPIERIALAVGTPVYVYSATALAAAYDAYEAAFAGVPHTLCYSIKSNANLAVVRVLVRRGAGVDVTSGGELFRALRAGADPARIVYSGVGKTDAEIDAALAARVKLFNVESRAELRRIDARRSPSASTPTSTRRRTRTFRRGCARASSGFRSGRPRRPTPRPRPSTTWRWSASTATSARSS
jgi:diaminopimelate decarboxylase